MSKFDWYSASYRGSHALVVGAVEEKLGGWVEKAEKGRHGFENALRLRADRGFHAFTQWGGSLHGDLVHVAFSGGRSGEGAQLLRELAPGHRVSRVDVAEDIVGPRALAELSRLSARVARDHGVKRTRILPDNRDEGLTIYLGSRLSPVFGRIYEKGKQLKHSDLQVDEVALNEELKGYPLESWVRCEIEVKPQSHAKGYVAGLSPEEVWGCSGWSADLFHQLTGIESPRVSVGAIWKADDLTRATAHLVEQYGATLRALRALEGSWPAVGALLGDMVEGTKSSLGCGGE